MNQLVVDLDFERTDSLCESSYLDVSDSSFDVSLQLSIEAEVTTIGTIFYFHIDHHIYTFNHAIFVNPFKSIEFYV